MNKRIEILDQCGQLISFFGEDRGFVGSTKICACPSRIYVLDLDVIRVFDQDYRFLFAKGVGNVLHMACVKEGGLVLMVHKVPSFELYDQDINLVRTIDIPSTRWYTMTVNSKDQIIIGDHTTRKISTFDMNGNLLCTFYIRREYFNHKTRYSQICVDQSDNIIVIDSRHEKVSILSPYGILIQRIKHSGTPFV